MATVSNIALNIAAGMYGGDTLIAAFSIVNKVTALIQSVLKGIFQGAQSIFSYNKGAKRYDRVLDSYRFSSRVAILGGLVMGGLCAAFANPIIRLFTETDPDMMALGALCIRLQCLVLPVHGWVAVVNMFCSGLGRAKQAVLLSTSRQGSCFLPIVYPLAWLFGANGVASVQAVADLLTVLLAVPVIRFVLRDVRQHAAEAGQLDLAVKGR